MIPADIDEEFFETTPPGWRLLRTGTWFLVAAMVMSAAMMFHVLVGYHAGSSYGTMPVFGRRGSFATHNWRSLLGLVFAVASGVFSCIALSRVRGRWLVLSLIQICISACVIVVLYCIYVGVRPAYLFFHP